MEISKKRFSFTGTLLFASLPLMYHAALYAAEPVNLRHQTVTALQTMLAAPSTANNAIAIRELSRKLDFKNTLHVRIQQTYLGYDVFGADAVVHIPNGTNTEKSLSGAMNAAEHNGSMNGILYQDLSTDLNNAPTFVFTQEQAQKATREAVEQFQTKAASKMTISEQKNTLVVFVGKDKKAHWAYKVTFHAVPAKSSEKPSRPIYILDAVTFAVYAKWDMIETIEEMTKGDDGGGFGGNEKMGKLIYDGAKKDLAKLIVTRNKSLCTLQNDDVTVADYTSNNILQFKCTKKDKSHNNVYWDGSFDAVNGGYSPGNDALFGGQVIKNLYQDWYGLNVLEDNGKAMMLNMVVHIPEYDNAYWDPIVSTMFFGDGYEYFYPLTSLGVAAHEISHGFTSQHSNLDYDGQSGGMNESYSDMAAQAAEVYAYGKGKNSWQIGPEIYKEEGKALRYMDQPSKDCDGGTPGDWCSIDDASQYYDGLDVHFSSGVYNHFFYLLGTTKKWTVQKAFDVMVKANTDYWTHGTNFTEGACGVISAAEDLDYDVKAVKKAFDKVKVDYSDCN